MARTTFRPFSKLITLASNGEADVLLSDSTHGPASSTTMNGCNYVSVESASGTAPDGYILVQPTSGITAAVSAHPGGGPSGTDGSGMLGVILPNLNGVAQLVLGGKDRIRGIHLWNTGVTATTCIITYGNVCVQNTLKDGLYGNPMGT